ncbi:MAG TPA: preprotein translocase subunit YajC [Microbacteriaceae bacterium]|nr:preprotein translocase subunit YajC [Microbacteriaceae bacterium]
MDPISLVMLAMIGLLIIFMVRNGRKRREMMAKLQDGIKPGAEVMMQSGIYGTVESVDEEDANRVLLRSGDSTLLVHRSAIGNIVAPIEVEEVEDRNDLAPDDDPNFTVSSGDNFDGTSEQTDVAGDEDTKNNKES